MGLYLVIALVVTFTLSVNTTLSAAYNYQKNATMRYFAGMTTTIVDLAQQYPATLKLTKSNYAFTTLFASDAARPGDQGDLRGYYFITTRILANQILHAPQTRSKGIPFIVLTTKSDSEAKRERLRRDGAIVLAVDSVEKPGWVGGGTSNWRQPTSSPASPK
jgi:alpha-N-acetylglucosamine transferase